MRVLLSSLLLGTAVLAGAKELTPETWEDAVAGKTVFIKFLAPWCGHCKSMKPAWDKLAKEYADSTTALVADVDCTAEGKDLCETHGVEGFPTIKWGDPSALETYEGGRDFKALKEFAKENLKPLCSPSNLDLCDDDKKKQIETLLEAKDLDEQIETKEKEQKAAEEEFEEAVKALQENYEKLEKTKNEKVEAVKESGLGLMKAVKAFKKKGDKKSEEL